MSKLNSPAALLLLFIVLSDRRQLLLFVSSHLGHGIDKSRKSSTRYFLLLQVSFWARFCEILKHTEPQKKEMHPCTRRGIDAILPTTATPVVAVAALG